MGYPRERGIRPWSLASAQNPYDPIIKRGKHLRRHAHVDWLPCKIYTHDASVLKNEELNLNLERPNYPPNYLKLKNAKFDLKVY